MDAVYHYGTSDGKTTGNMMSPTMLIGHGP